eukprot:Skav212489  [mRNA]  locus=scaffold6473:23960:25131:- [translate_table: standard]
MEKLGQKCEWREPDLVQPLYGTSPWSMQCHGKGLGCHSKSCDPPESVGMLSLFEKPREGLNQTQVVCGPALLASQEDDSNNAECWQQCSRQSL